MGRASIFVPAMVTVLGIAAVASALTRRSNLQVALLGAVVAGLVATGWLWIWIHLLKYSIVFPLFVAAGVASVGVVSAVASAPQRLKAVGYGVAGLALGLVLIGFGVAMSTTRTCGSGSFHVDTWDPPGAIYICADGRLSVERIR
jgi:hypothetical protein